MPKAVKVNSIYRNLTNINTSLTTLTKNTIVFERIQQWFQQLDFNIHSKGPENIQDAEEGGGALRAAVWSKVSLGGFAKMELRLLIHVRNDLFRLRKLSKDPTVGQVQLYSFNRMQFSYENLQTLRKPGRIGQISRARSLDHFNFQQLNTQQLKLLLDIPKKPSEGFLQQAIMKQELLIHKKLFDPFKYFGCPNFISLEESQRFHQFRFEAMFTCGTTQRKASSKLTAERKTSKLGEVSPASRCKESVVSSQKNRRTVGRSPKSFVKENKQNYQRLNINNMQKVRVKLKLGKK